jgi:fermentation-respiration switch protein FrsA (DUF1100 family)
MFSLYRLIPILYLLLPMSALGWAIRGRPGRRGVGAPQSFAGLCLAGGLLGLAVSQSWSWMLHTQVPVEQTAVTMYWMTATLFGLAGINLLCNRALQSLLRGCIARSTTGIRRRFFALAAGLLVMTKFAVMMTIGVSVLSATLLSFRPKVVHTGTPATLLNASFQTIDFRATDGTTLRGWWIASPGTDAGGRETVVLCHGFGGDKASALPMAQDLLAAGFNVLAFDFRAHGESAGHLTTFGNIERRDVLGAVRWLRTIHPGQSRRIVGLGINMGASALIAAAGDPGPDGQAIDAVAAIDPIDDAGQWLSDLAEQRIAPGAGVFLARVALPLAGAQCGVNLFNWSAANDVQQLWPRPLLIIGSGQDELVPMTCGQALFDSAQQPKYHYWIDDENSRNSTGQDDQTARVLSVFFRTARTII